MAHSWVTAPAKALSWFVGVVDHRPAFAQPARFPEADAVRSGHPAQVLPTLPLDARSAVVLMTHHYAKDLEALRLLLPSQAGYLGLMGSRARGARLLGELAAEGLHPDARLHTPVGLDLGATEPEGIAGLSLKPAGSMLDMKCDKAGSATVIALAILAEVQGFAADRSGLPLSGTRTQATP